jgi:anti-sigma factor RsiW
MVPNNMVQCDEMAPLLGPFEDGELPPHEMQEVARHLASCTNCENVLAAYSSIGRLLREAAPTPSLEGFAMAVQAGIEQLRPPLLGRLSRWFETQRERFGNGAALAFAMGVAAIVTIAITTPLARNMTGAGGHSVQLAARDAVKSRARLASVSGEPNTIISKLETSNPDVAVWSEPSQNTTVIWLPDQQH